jgi:cobalt/nickel transport system ATP-binding protein
VIEVNNLHYRYAGSEPVLQGIDYRQERGTSVALFGRNGSGKTTFAFHLNGILLGEGEVKVAGITVTAETLDAVREKVGFVFQSSENQLFLPTVLEDVMFGLLNAGIDADTARAKAMAMLDRLGLAAHANRNPFHMSAGEKRRAALAGVLVMEPEVLILDEPTTFLDPPGVRELAAILNALPITKILITHDAEFAFRTTSEAVFFERGKIIDRGPTATLIDRFEWH